MTEGSNKKNAGLCNWREWTGFGVREWSVATAQKSECRRNPQGMQGLGSFEFFKKSGKAEKWLPQFSDRVAIAAAVGGHHPPAVVVAEPEGEVAPVGVAVNVRVVLPACPIPHLRSGSADAANHRLERLQPDSFQRARSEPCGQCQFGEALFLKICDNSACETRMAHISATPEVSTSALQLIPIICDFSFRSGPPLSPGPTFEL